MAWVMGFLFLCLFGVIGLGLAQVLFRGRVSADAWPVFARPVMSEPERVLYARLREALPDLLVLPQVQLCRFVEVRPVRNRYVVLNRYGRLSADFVVCRPDSAVEVVVELDDSSHARAKARRNDAKKDAVLKAAGIRVVRFHVRSLPSSGRLRQELFPSVGSRAGGLDAGAGPA